MVGDRERLCEAVHTLLERLPPLRGKPCAALPRDGVYFWYENGETRQGHGPRVTRVGTHTSPGRLLARIREHFGSNREGSVFRRHVGAALMARNGEAEQDIREWARGPRSAGFRDERFEEYELRVTAQSHLGLYRVLKVDEPRERLELEEKLVALFSHCAHCLASPDWLGRWAPRQEIRRSGLWNVRYVWSPNELKSTDLERLQQLVDETARGEWCAEGGRCVKGDGPSGPPVPRLASYPPELPACCAGDGRSPQQMASDSSLAPEVGESVAQEILRLLPAA